MTDMQRIEGAAKQIASIVKDAGGYISYADLDNKRQDVYIPQVTLCGWGSPESFERNQTIVAAHAACDMGLLINTGEGYKTVTSVQEGK